MAYRIAYGMDTGSFEDPDQLVLLDLPDECAEMDGDELQEYIDNNWDLAPSVAGWAPPKDYIASQPLVGADDIADEIKMRCEQLHHVSPDHCAMCGPIIKMVRDR